MDVFAIMLGMATGEKLYGMRKVVYFGLITASLFYLGVMVVFAKAIFVYM